MEMGVWSTAHSSPVQRLPGICLYAGGHEGRPSSVSGEGGLRQGRVDPRKVRSSLRRQDFRWRMLKVTGLGSSPQPH